MCVHTTSEAFLLKSSILLATDTLIVLVKEGEMLNLRFEMYI